MKFISLLLTLVVLAPSLARAAEQRTYAGMNASVSVNGVVCPEIRSWSGGQPRGTVSASGFGKKQITGITYDPLVLVTAAPLSPALANAVDAFARGQTATVNLTLGWIRTGGSGITLQANNARLTGVEFPALNGASKELVYAQLTFAAPALTPVATSSDRRSNGKTKTALSANFRLAIDGLPATRVASISALTLGKPAAGNSGVLPALTGTGAPEVSNLTLEISSADEAAWTTWRDQFLIQGQNADAQEKNATITLLDSAMKDALFTLSLSHVGIVRLEPTSYDDEKVSRFEVELYVESVRVTTAAAENAIKPEEPVAPPAKAADLRQKQAELDALVLRKKSLQQIVATQEAEKQSIEPQAKETWAKTRLPTLTKLLDASKTDLAQVDQDLKKTQDELAALQKPATPPPAKP